MVAKVGVAGTRVALASAWARLDAADPAAARLQRAMMGLLALDGLVWGLGGWALMDEPVTMVALAMAALDGVSCVATFGLQVSLAATAAYVLPMLLPMVAGLALRPDDFAHLAALGQLLLAALLLATSRAASLRLTTGLLIAHAGRRTRRREGRRPAPGARAECRATAVSREGEPRAAHAAARHCWA